MILVDTSIWIAYFNGKTSKFTDSLDQALIDGTVAMGDLIFLEILQGFKDDKDYRRAKSTLLTLNQYEMLRGDMVLKSADNYRTLRKTGITIRSTIDVIIATYCIDNQLPLLFSDKDFEPFVNKLGLTSAIKET